MSEQNLQEEKESDIEKSKPKKFNLQGGKHNNNNNNDNNILLNDGYIKVKASTLAEILFDGYRDTYRARLNLYLALGKELHDILQAIADSDPEETKYHLEKYDNSEGSLVYDKAECNKGVYVLWRIEDWQRTSKLLNYKKEESEERIAYYNWIKDRLQRVLEGGKDNPLFGTLLMSLPNKPKDKVEILLQKLEDINIDDDDEKEHKQ